MAQQTPAHRIRQRYSSRTWMKLIVFLAVYYFIAGLIIPALRDGGLSWERIVGIIDNLSTEVIGAAVTFFIFELILERRDQERDMLRALHQMRSTANDTALSAVDVMREEGFIYDGSLNGIDLDGANLEGVRLYSANLQGALLGHGNLKKADFNGANLAGADFEHADLDEAFFGGANLRQAKMHAVVLEGASFKFANLEGADLEYAMLDGTQLWGANLLNVNFEHARFREDTTLPDDDPNGERSFWKHDTDMKRFTDPEHPNFWQPEWVRAGFKSYGGWYISTRQGEGDKTSENYT